MLNCFKEKEQKPQFIGNLKIKHFHNDTSHWKNFQEQSPLTWLEKLYLPYLRNALYRNLDSENNFTNLRSERSEVVDHFVELLANVNWKQFIRAMGSICEQSLVCREIIEELFGSNRTMEEEEDTLFLTGGWWWFRVS